jgi:phenylacetic acid degradation protein paaN
MKGAMSSKQAIGQLNKNKHCESGNEINTIFCDNGIKVSKLVLCKRALTTMSNRGTHMKEFTAVFETHKTTIIEAIQAIHTRSFHAHWPEVPSGKIYGETAQADGEAAFKALLNSRFEGLEQETPEAWAGAESSPYGFELGVQYPYFDPDTLVHRANAAFPAWRALHPMDRAGLLVEALEASSRNFFPIAFATMHTTGQGFVMAFQASGPHAYDRALEAVALGYREMTRFPETAAWEKPMGKVTVSLQKKYRALGRGVGVVIGCSTFPVWNSFPGIFANLVTGNTVIVKPHPGAILPIAIAVADIRRTLREHGVNPDVIQLGVDGEHLIAKRLAENPGVNLIDYTGGSAFGEYLENLPGKIVFSEKAGVNSIIMDSVDNLDAALDNIAFSLSLYSGQMCTTPQNIFIPKSGIMAGGAPLSYTEFTKKLTQKVDELVNNPKLGPGTLGAIQNSATAARVSSVKDLGCAVLLESRTVAQAGFDAARSISPVIAEVPAEKPELFTKEMFGPIAFVISTDDTEHSLSLAVETARRAGSITCAAYATDSSTMDKIEDAMLSVGAPVSFNLTGPIWMNQAATYSDFHVTAGNPSGNASLVNPEFVVRRFFVAGSRRPA